MIKKVAVPDAAIITAPTVMRTMLACPIHRSRVATCIWERRKLIMRGRMTVNKMMFTPARNDRSSPAC
jgi:hypothetical protein